MLSEYNERLTGLQEKITRCSRMDGMLRELRAQETELAQQVGELTMLLFKEQEDVDRLTGGFRAVFYAVLGKRKEMLEKEREEVLRASVQLAAAKAELKRVQEEKERIDWEAGQIKKYEREYRETLEQKLKAMKELGVFAGEIMEAEENRRRIDAELKEIGEAMTAGRRVMNQIESISDQMNGAEGHAVWDTWFGGGLIADAAKYSHLEEAQQGIQCLEALLRKFRTELADISVRADVCVHVGDGLKAADVFFDNIFADHAVLSRIRESQESLKSIGRQVQKAMDRLHEMERELTAQRGRIGREITALAGRI